MRFLRRGSCQKPTIVMPCPGICGKRETERERENLPGRQPPYYPGAGDRGMTYRYHVLEFGFEYTYGANDKPLATLYGFEREGHNVPVEILGSTDGDESI